MALVRRIASPVSKGLPLICIALFGASLTLAIVSGANQARAAAGDESQPYEWSAELISFDPESETAVLQARVVSRSGIEGLDSFANGDRLILTWSGRNWASGVRGLAGDPELTPETLSLPVEFVSSEKDGAYVRFRISVPEAAIETIAEFDPGARVTGTSHRMASDWDTAVSSLRHYNDVD